MGAFPFFRIARMSFEGEGDALFLGDCGQSVGIVDEDALRKTQRTTAVSIGTLAASDEMSFEDVLSSLSCDDALPTEELERQETAARVNEVITQMPESLREILILAYFNKFSYKQMADVLSIPIGTVKSRLHTAVGRFAKDWKALSASEATQ